MGHGISKKSPSPSEVKGEAQLSALYLACEKGDVDAVKLILSSTSYNKLNGKEINGSTALHAAVASGEHRNYQTSVN